VSKPGVSPDGSPIRLRQHGTFVSFSQKICTLCKFFGKKNEIFHPAGDDIRHQTRNRLMHGSIGRFAGFVHVVVFVVQTPTA